MPTIEDLLEIASRYPTSMADALFAACVEKALGGEGEEPPESSPMRRATSPIPSHGDADA